MSYQEPKKFNHLIVFFCYIAGVIDRWMGVKFVDSVFVSKRKAAFTEYISYIVRSLENKTAEPRCKAQSIMSFLENDDKIIGNGLGEQRKRAVIREQCEEMIKLDNEIISQTVKARERIYPYLDKLHAQILAYANGLKFPVSAVKLSEIFLIDDSDAIFTYQQAHSEVDNAIHEKVMSFCKTESEG